MDSNSSTSEEQGSIVVSEASKVLSDRMLLRPTVIKHHLPPILWTSASIIIFFCLWCSTFAQHGVTTTVQVVLSAYVLLSIGVVVAHHLDQVFRGKIEFTELGVQSRHILLNKKLDRDIVYPWSLLYSVSVETGDFKFFRSREGSNFFAPSRGKKLEVAHLRFETGEDVSVPLFQMQLEDQQKFFIALDKWASPFCLGPEVLEIGQKILGPAALETSTFTQFWEEELRSRYGATTFQTLNIGTTLAKGRYVIQRNIGCGGFSAAYLAKDTEQNRFTVVKETALSENMREGERAHLTEMLSRETQILKKVDHSNVNKVFDYFIESERHYLILEYIPGITLRHQIAATGKQSEQRVLQWSSQIASVLEYLHSSEPQILHRDVTPDNLIINSERAILVDFGSAKEVVENLTGTAIGKQAYIPAEQFRGKATPRSDVYALARCMYFALIGEDAEPLSEIPSAISVSCSPELNALISQCASVEESTRLTSSELASRLKVLAS